MTAPAWIPVASLDDFAATDAIAVRCAGREIALFLVGDAVYATANRCTHGDARLCDGYLEGHEIECPYHQGRFDVRSGAATLAPAEVALATWPARVVDGRVELCVERG
jgi:naphthalene 1,2-dioxygenase system ferredoxin subunit